MKIMNQFMVDKRDALVLKFIINLKQKMLDQKDLRVQQENEKIVEEILKRINFQKKSKSFNINRDVDFESAHTSSLPTKLMQSLEVRI